MTFFNFPSKTISVFSGIGVKYHAWSLSVSNAEISLTAGKNKFYWSPPSCIYFLEDCRQGMWVICHCNGTRVVCLESISMLRVIYALFPRVFGKYIHLCMLQLILYVSGLSRTPTGFEENRLCRRWSMSTCSRSDSMAALFWRKVKGSFSIPHLRDGNAYTVSVTGRGNN
jgi:hypothetical protein